MRWCKFLIVPGIVFVILFGCTPFRPPLHPSGSQQAWQERQLALRELEGWKLKGRLAINALEEAWTGTLRWIQNGSKFEILWTAPFGQGSVELQGNREMVTLRVPKEEPMTAASAEELLWMRLGWSLPVNGLRYWLLGLPAPELPIAKLSLDSFGRLLRLSQGGWQIRYLNYTPVRSYELPSKVFLDNPKFRLRLVIDRWRLV